MRILGIDPSLTSTGAVLLDDGEVLWAERWSPPPIIGVDRLGFFYAQMVAALADKPDLVAIEGYSYASKGRSLFDLGELGGVYRLAVWQAIIPLEVIPAATWRKQLLGKGNLPKEQVRLAVYKKFGFEHPSLDVIEAWCIAQTAQRRLMEAA